MGMDMGMDMVVCIDGVGGGGGEAVAGAAGSMVVVVSDELAAVVTWLPALSSHMHQQYVE
jgi:hypothetical protein